MTPAVNPKIFSWTKIIGHFWKLSWALILKFIFKHPKTWATLISVKVISHLLSYFNLKFFLLTGRSTSSCFAKLASSASFSSLLNWDPMSPYLEQNISFFMLVTKLKIIANWNFLWKLFFWSNLFGLIKDWMGMRSVFCQVLNSWCIIKKVLTESQEKNCSLNYKLGTSKR